MSKLLSHPEHLVFWKLLEVSFEIEIPVEWIRTVLQHDGFVKIKDVRTGDKREVSDFVELSTGNLEADTLLNHLKKGRNLQWIDLKEVERGIVVGTIKTSCPVCSVFDHLDCFLVSAVTKKDGMMEWHLFTSDAEELKKLYQRLEKNGIRYRILSVTGRLGRKEMTARQEELLKVAYELGFYEFPKRITLKILSERLGVSPGTLSEILRRAQKNLLTAYFKKGR